MVRRIPLPFLLVLLLPACADLAALDGGGETPALSGSEQAHVRGQVDKALAEQRFKTAWNQEVAAGADRARLEHIAVTALEGNSGHAEDMFEALRLKHGALSAASRAQVDRLVAKARQEGAWSRALEVELLTADDVPDFQRAWAVYRAAPVERSQSLLDSITAAKAAASAAKGSGD